MSLELGICSQCGDIFDVRDGYPDLYDKKLCSPGCQTQWLIRWQYRSSLQDPPVMQASDEVLVQIADNPQTFPGTGDPLEDPWKQME